MDLRGCGKCDGSLRQVDAARYVCVFCAAEYDSAGNVISSAPDPVISGTPLIPPPTPEDLARDLAADLAVCDAATPGPWTWMDRSCDDGPNRNTLTTYRPVKDDFERRLFGERRPLSIVGCFDCGCTAPDADREFLALARTALPAYIRLLAAERAETAWLRSQVLQLTPSAYGGTQ